MASVPSTPTASSPDSETTTINTAYGSMKRTHSSSKFSRVGSASDMALSRSGSFHDLPLVAVSGMASRVSISGITSASSKDLHQLFRQHSSKGHLDGLEVEAVFHEGGWTLPLIISASGALLSALCFGYNNGNMNTQAAVMRDALGLPSQLDPQCSMQSGQSVLLPANDAIWGFCVSSFCLSALGGSGVAGRIADSYGRRTFLLGNSLLYLLGGIVECASFWAACPPPINPCAIEPCLASIALLLCGRLLTGIACGGSTVVVPMYLGEIVRGCASTASLVLCSSCVPTPRLQLTRAPQAPAHLRGTLGSAFLLTAVSGMLVGQVAGLPQALGTPELWWWILGGAGFPAILQLSSFGGLIESPRWMLQGGDEVSAAVALARLRGCAVEDGELLLELASMGSPVKSSGVRGKAEGTAFFDEALLEPMLDGASGAGDGGAGGHSRAESTEHASESWIALDLFADPALRRPLCVCVTLMAAQQLSGINNAFNYSSTFFMANGLSDTAVTAIAVGMNVGNVLIVLLSTMLMDLAGRRVLLLTSIGGMVVAIFMLTAALLLGYVVLVCVGIVVFVISFGLGLGPVVWLLPAELFPMSKRAPATAAVTSINWLANYVVAQAFPLVASWLGPLSFVPFGFVLVAAMWFTWNEVPETRGRTLEEIELMMRSPSRNGRRQGVRRRL